MHLTFALQIKEYASNDQNIIISFILRLLQEIVEEDNFVGLRNFDVELYIQTCKFDLSIFSFLFVGVCQVRIRDRLQLSCPAEESAGESHPSRPNRA